MTIQTIQRAFVGGEISPALRSRADLVKYTTGLERCENFIVRAQGGAYFRPGFRYVGELTDSSRKGRLIPFVFNQEQTYVLVFEHMKMKVISGGGFVLEPFINVTDIVSTEGSGYTTITAAAHQYSNGDTVYFTGTDTRLDNRYHVISNVTTNTFRVGGEYPSNDPDGFVYRMYEMATPYTDDELPRIQFVQDADTVTLVHPNHNPKYLIRLDNDDWDLSDVNFAPSISPPTGLTTASVGGGHASENKTYYYVVTAVSLDGEESLPSASVNRSTGALTETGGIKLTWDPVPGAFFYKIYKDPSLATGIYGQIGEATGTEFSDFNIAPVTSLSPPEDRRPFDGANDKPSTVGFYQQRAIFANTFNEPQTVYTSQSGLYSSMRRSSPSRDDDAVTFTVKSRQVNEIRHIVTLDSLLLLTSGNEWRVTEGQDQVLTPNTIGVRPQSYFGCSWVSPVVVGNNILYVQDKGTRIRDLKYEYTDDRYTGNDLSLMAEHLFEGHEVVEMAYAREPYGIVWVVRNDGVLLGLTYQRDQDVWAWHQHTTKGQFEACTTIPEGDRDSLYVIVKREINGQTRRFIERMETLLSPEEEMADNAFHVDSGLSVYPPTDPNDSLFFAELYGLDHLIGETVTLVINGINLGDRVVDEEGGITDLGTLTFWDNPTIHVGLSYTGVLETLDMDVPSLSESLRGRDITISEVKLELLSSRGGWVGTKGSKVKDLASPTVYSGVIDPETGRTRIKETNDLNMQQIRFREVEDEYDVMPLKTRIFSHKVLPGWSDTGGVRIEQREPLPMALMSLILEVDVT